MVLGEDGHRDDTGQTAGLAVVHHRLQLPLPAGGFADPGAIAWDALDGNLTSLIRVQLSSADMSVPTPPGVPIIFTYTVFDSAGNKALGERHLHLVCGALERICEFEDGRRLCSTEGVCMPVSFEGLMDAEAPSREAPTIALIGGPVVRLPRYSDYPVCAPNTPWAR